MSSASHSDDSSDEELFPVNHANCQPIFQYDDPLLVSGVLKAVVNGDLGRLKELVEAGKSINLNDNTGNTAMHVSVMKNNIEILKYLLSNEDIIINRRNFLGQTPLFLAVKYGHIELTKCLIDNGANVNISNYEDITPLHASVHYPDIAHLLIKSGAVLDVEDYSNDMPLHDAVAEGYLETVCMFLYYNADGNRVGGNNLNPFMKALIVGNVEIQEALFEYTDNFNICDAVGMSTLALALSHNTTLTEEIINRGAIVDLHAYSVCLRVPNTKKFKLVWERLGPEEASDIRLLDLFFQLDHKFLQNYIDIIIDHSQSSVLTVIAANTSSKDLAFLIEKSTINNWLNLDSISKLTCLLLQHGFEVDTFVIHETLINFGCCELFKILLFMDYRSNWSPFMITSRLIFDINTDIKRRCDELLMISDRWTNVAKLREDVKHAFSFWACHRLFDICLKEFNDERMLDFANDGFRNFPEISPMFPSLLELARNESRKYIISYFNLNRTSQYYTIVNHLNISPVYKKILMFDRKLYQIYQI
ncbi:unnamed protein product [Phaedon cochleariae]|uniref:Ankyrin repeat protein n=1 Tax=Phaedon cochleariae TaxID=80249 RepID=A0A9P0GTE8_PHACE|nr:unnamed protein product [Phaedon cochleariae]